MSGTDDAVYRGMSRAELDRQYNARGTVEDIGPFLDAYTKRSASARQSLEVMENIRFGPHPDETLDYFPAKDGAPLFIFVHGGYWKLLSKNESAFMAENFVRQNIAVASTNYSLAPAASLDEIVRQVRAAVAFLWTNAAQYGFDRERIYIGGSSAGAHLAAMALCQGWQDRLHLPERPLAGALLASGLYDLEPLVHCHPNDWLFLDEQDALRNSPLHHMPDRLPPVIVSWAGSETDEFKRQSRLFLQAAIAIDCRATSLEVSDRNHFDIVLDLCDPDRELCRQTVNMICSG